MCIPSTWHSSWLTVYIHNMFVEFVHFGTKLSKNSAETGAKLLMGAGGFTNQEVCSLALFLGTFVLDWIFVALKTRNFLFSPPVAIETGTAWKSSWAIHQPPWLRRGWRTLCQWHPDPSGDVAIAQSHGTSVVLSLRRNFSWPSYLKLCTNCLGTLPASLPHSSLIRRIAEWPSQTSREKKTWQI